jgi:large repetitive protein
MNGLTQSRQGTIVAVMAALLVLASAGYGAPIPVTNGVPLTGLSGAAGSSTVYALALPAGQDHLEIAISGGTGDCDLYVKKDAAPTLTSYDYRPFKVGNNETVDVNSPAAGTWYIMLYGYDAYANLTLVATYSSSTHITTLTNNVAVPGLSGTASGESYFQIVVPTGQTKLEISITGQPSGTGDCDLYVKKDSMPTTTTFDYRPFLAGSEEKVTITNPVAGTWYIMLRGFSAYTGVTLLGSYSGTVGTLLVNGVAVTGLNGTAASEALYRIEVPDSQMSMQIQITGGTGDCDLYVKLGTPPTVSSYDYRPFVAGNEETVDINSPAAGTWYIMLRGYADYAGVSLKATYGGIVTLADGVPVAGIAGALNSERFYQLDVPAGCSDVTFSITGGTGNCDLYLRLGAKPTTATYDYRPYLSGNAESVTVTNPHSGTWYVMLKGRAAYSGVTLLGDYTIPSTIRTLVNGVAVTGLAGATDSDLLYQITVPSGQTSLVVQISGSSGDCDLYVKKGAVPTLTDWDYRPFLDGSNETATISNPDATTWYVMLHGFQAYSNLTLIATYSGGGGPTDTVLTNAVAATGLSGATGSSSFFKIDVPINQAQITFTTWGGTGDADMYIRRGSRPTTSAYDYRVAISGNDESQSITLPDAGTWYVLLYGHTAYSNANLIATYIAVDTTVELTNGVPLPGQSGAQYSSKYYKIVVPAGQDYLHITTTGTTGDVDLYVKRGSKPTTSDYGRISDAGFPNPDNETVDVNSPAAGTWYILLYGYWSYSGVTVTATYGVSIPAGNYFNTDPNCVAVWNLEPNALTTNSLSTTANKLTNTGVTSNTTDFQRGAGSAVFHSATMTRLSITDANLSPKFPTKSTGTTTVFSGACWFKLNGLTSTSYLMSKYTPPGSKMSWGIGVLYEGSVIFRIGYSSGGGTEFRTALSPNKIAAGKWYHIGFTYNDATKTCYFRVYDKAADSVIINEATTFNYNISMTTAAFVLGGTEYPDAGYSVDGLMDEVLVFNDLLTTAEIDKIRQNTYGH